MDFAYKVPAFRRDFSIEEFNLWKSMVEDYIVAQGIVRPARKLAVMRVMGGIELVELLRDLPESDGDGDVYEMGLAKLDEYFTQMFNPIQEKMEFRKMAQNPGEKIKEFVVRLRKKARTCSFSDPEKEIFEQLIQGTLDVNVKRKALRQRLMNVEQVVEEGTINETLNATLKPENAINAVQTTKSAPRKQVVCYGCSEVGHYKSECPKAIRKDIRCHNCRELGHIAIKCPKSASKEVKCFACGVTGHIARVCPQVARGSQSKRFSSTESADSQPEKRTKTKKTHCVEEERINFLNGGKSVDCLIGGVKLTLLIDSGCTSNIIDAQGFEMLRLQKARLEFSENVDKTFVPFGASTPLATAGVFKAKLEIGDKSVEAKFYVLKIKARCLLGSESAQEIGLLKIGLNEVSKF